MPIPGIIGVVQYTSTTKVNLFSPAIWGNCPVEDLNDEGKGYYLQSHFASGLVAFASTVGTNGTVAIDTGSTTFGYDHIIKLTTGSTATAVLLDKAWINTRPLAPVVPGGLGVWFETAVTPAASTGTQSMFVGLTTSTGITGGVIGSTTAVASTNKLNAATAAIGFWMHGDTPNNCDAIFVASTGGVSTVLANVLTASTANPNPANPTFQPFTSPGAFVPSTVTKLGLLYQPSNATMTWYVNGFPIAAAQVTAGTFDTTDNYAGIVEFHGTTVSLECDFLAVAAQVVL